MRRVWSATLDEDTRVNHQELDGEKVEMDELFEIDGYKAEYPSGFGVAKMDINCRCSVRAEIEGYEPEVRRAREVEGERGEIRSYRTYNEWAKERKPS